MNSFSKERDEALQLHPTVKPLALVRDAIFDASMRDDIVLDPFGGSGTTLLAADAARRRARWHCQTNVAAILSRCYRLQMSRKSRAKPPSPFRYFNSSPEVIRLVVMMYVRFPLSLRNVEDLLFERSIDVCHETVRMWWNRFGPMFAGNIRRQRVSRMRGFRHWRWHLDEMYVKLNGEMVYLWRAVDHEGEVLESFVTKTRDKEAALTFMKKALKRHGKPEAVTTDGLRSYRAAMNELGNAEKQEVGRWANNRVENSHLPFRRRERAMLRFRRMSSLQKFASVHANVHNHFNLERHLVDRTTYKERRAAALAAWQLVAS